MNTSDAVLTVIYIAVGSALAAAFILLPLAIIAARHIGARNRQRHANRRTP